MKHLVYSTLSADTIYAHYEKSENDMPKRVRHVLIKGGANVADNKMTIGTSNVTPKGIMTEVTDEELTILKSNTVFQLHEKNGFIIIESALTKLGASDPDKKAEDMEVDVSAPKTPEYFEKKNKERDQATVSLKSKK